MSFASVGHVHKRASWSTLRRWASRGCSNSSGHDPSIVIATIRRLSVVSSSSSSSSSAYVANSGRRSIIESCSSLNDHRVLKHPSTLILCQSYVSRAHPEPTPIFPIEVALQKVLQDASERVKAREKKWELNREKRKSRGENVDTGFRETVEMAVNLNLDPRKPGQALRGSIDLPYGTGKTIRVAVFTGSKDEDMLNSLKEAGAEAVGGEDLIDSIVNGEVNIEAFDRTIGTNDMIPYLSKKLARVLGPRGLMPNSKVGTLVREPEQLPSLLKRQLAGQLQYRTDKAGTIHFGIGRANFPLEHVLANVRSVMETLMDVKPEKYGKGKNPSSNAKYFLSSYVTATQMKGSVKLDVRTIDPSSAFFMGKPMK